MNHHSCHLAQINISRLKAPLEDPLLADFVKQLIPVNEAADQAPGFVWRLQSENGYSSDVEAFDDPLIIINLTVWESIEALFNFAYKNQVHLEVFTKRKKWMEPIKPSLALFGEADDNVVPNVNIPIIKRALQSSDNPDATVELISKANHSFFLVSEGNPLSRYHLQSGFSPTTWNIIRDWLGKRVNLFTPN